MKNIVTLKGYYQHVSTKFLRLTLGLLLAATLAACSTLSQNNNDKNLPATEAKGDSKSIDQATAINNAIYPINQ